MDTIYIPYTYQFRDCRYGTDTIPAAADTLCSASVLICSGLICPDLICAGISRRRFLQIRLDFEFVPGAASGAGTGDGFRLCLPGACPLGQVSGQLLARADAG